MRLCGPLAGAVTIALVAVGCGSEDSSSASGAGASGGSAGAAGSAAGNAGAAGTDGSAGSAGSGGTSGGAGTAGSAGTGGSGGAGTLPEGDTGIASEHPGDVGIASDPDVLFAEDFEAHSVVGDLDRKWDHVFQRQHTRIATEPGNFNGGEKALEFTVPQRDAELSNAVAKTLSPARDALFLRYYSKFDTPFDVVGSSHNGSSISAQYFPGGQATPGVPADGTNKFLANLENWRGDPSTPSPGELNVYIYHPAQRSQWGDHFFPSGRVLPNSSQPFDFGPDFVARPEQTPELARWYCYELMLHANTPGKKDGRIAGWVDGRLVADFPNLRLRDIASLKIDRFGLDFHIGRNPNGETKKWYDDVVAATRYIGPLER